MSTLVQKLWVIRCALANAQTCLAETDPLSCDHPGYDKLEKCDDELCAARQSVEDELIAADVTSLDDLRIKAQLFDEVGKARAELGDASVVERLSRDFAEAGLRSNEF